MNHNQRIGAIGEEIATNYLQSIGYKIHSRNVRIHRDEIDIISYDPIDKVIVFVEVKTRSKLHPDYRPDLNITPAKRKSILRAAKRWIANHRYTKGYRIDLIYVAGNVIQQHVKEINGWY